MTPGLAYGLLILSSIIIFLLLAKCLTSNGTQTGFGIRSSYGTRASYGPYPGNVRAMTLDEINEIQGPWFPIERRGTSISAMGGYMTLS